MGEQIQFSEREKQVIELLIRGKSNKQIALSPGISVRAVEFHLSNIYATRQGAIAEPRIASTAILISSIAFLDFLQKVGRRKLVK